MRSNAQKSKMNDFFAEIKVMKDLVRKFLEISSKKTNKIIEITYKYSSIFLSLYIEYK